MLPGHLQMLGWGTIGSPSKVWDVVLPVGAVVLKKLRWVCTLVSLLLAGPAASEGHSQSLLARGSPVGAQFLLAVVKRPGGTLLPPFPPTET